MTGVLRRLEGYWFTEIPAARLAILRIVAGLFCLQYLASRVDTFGRLAGSHMDLYEPVGLANVLPSPMPVAMFQLLIGLTLVLNVAFVLGWRHRITGPLFAGLLLFVFCYRNSWSMVYHHDNLMVLQILVLGLTRSAEVLSL